MQKLWKWYAVFEDYLAGSLLFLGLGMVLINVILRYVPSWRPVAWVDEYSVWLVVWGTLIGTAVALRNDHHIKVMMLYNFLPLRAKRWVSVFANSLGLVFAVFFAYYGKKLVDFYLLTGMRSVNTQTPEWIIALVMPITGIMLSIRFVEKLVILLWNGGKIWFEKEAERKIDHGDISTI
ncbi:MAG: TRAP transporter small permease [Peptococcaceae bacterium]|nr:TRAP transporter small permease [Peptococcaceae bacterium]